MAVVSHPALSPEWSFPSPINPFDAPSFSSQVELADHVAVHQLQLTNKRRAHEIEWDNDDVVDRIESRVKKAKTSATHTVDPQHLQGNNPGPHTLPASQVASNAHVSTPQIERVISILIDAFASSNSTPPPDTSPTTSNSQAEQETTVSISSNVPTTRPLEIARSVPTSPLSECATRATFVRKVVGGSCAGRTEGSLTRWVLCRNHFLRVRSLDPTKQSSEWVHTLHKMGWEELHPYYQEQASKRTVQSLSSDIAFSRWIEDDFDYDGTEDGDGDWSDEEEEGEMHDDMREDRQYQQDGVWDSGVVLQLPGKAY